MSAPAISVEAIEKYFPPAAQGWRAFLQPFVKPTQRALARVSFEVARGEAVALVGSNGAGKSTLLRILATLVLPTSGRARIGGFDVEREPGRVRQQFGYHTGGDEGFYGRLSARDNLAFFASMNNMTGIAARERIAQVAQWMAIGPELDRPVRMLSTGMTHRLNLARALLHNPRILLLDEPTRSLDVLAAGDFRRLLKENLVRQHGTTLLFASHSVNEIEEIADRVVLLDEGRVVGCDSPRALCAANAASTLEDAIARRMRRRAGEEEAR